MSDQKSPDVHTKVNVPVKVNFDIDHHKESSSRRQGQGTYIEIFSENELTGLMSPIAECEDTIAGHTCPIKQSKKVHVVTPVKPKNSTTSAEQRWVSRKEIPHHVTHKQSDPVHKLEESSRSTTPKQVTPGKPIRVPVTARVIPQQATMVEQKEELQEDISRSYLKIPSADNKVSGSPVAVKTEKSELYKQTDRISEEVAEVTMNVTNKHAPVVPEVSAINQSSSAATQSPRSICEKHMPSPPTAAPKATDSGQTFKTRPRSHKLVSESDFSRYLSEQDASSQKVSQDSLPYAAVASEPKPSPVPWSATPATPAYRKTKGSVFGGATFPASCASCSPSISTGPLDSEIHRHALHIKPQPG